MENNRWVQEVSYVSSQLPLHVNESHEYCVYLRHGKSSLLSYQPSHRHTYLRKTGMLHTSSEKTLSRSKKEKKVKSLSIWSICHERGSRHCSLFFGMRSRKISIVSLYSQFPKRKSHMWNDERKFWYDATMLFDSRMIRQYRIKISILSYSICSTRQFSRFSYEK